MKGQYFEALVEAEQEIFQGQLLLTFDIEKIREAGYVTQVPIVVTNTPQYSSIEMLKQGFTNKNEIILTIKI